MRSADGLAHVPYNIDCYSDVKSTLAVESNSNLFHVFDIDLYILAIKRHTVYYVTIKGHIYPLQLSLAFYCVEGGQQKIKYFLPYQRNG